MRLKDTVAIVTGGGKGIGRYYARGLAAEGARVAIAEIDPEAAASAAAEIEAAGRVALAVQTDVADEASVKRMVDAAVSALGPITILVNNAAMCASVPFTQAPHDRICLEEWDRLFAVNVRAVWLCCREVIPHMRRQRYGKIVNVSSGTAWKGAPNALHYASSKAAVAGLTRALAREVGGDAGICVNTLAPGFTESDTFVRLVSPERRHQAVGERIIPRAQQPEDLVGTVIFLPSHDSDVITGQTIHVDGGSVLT